jgi:putative hydrolase of the HAD superfamily
LYDRCRDLFGDGYGEPQAAAIRGAIEDARKSWDEESLALYNRLFPGVMEEARKGYFAYELWSSLERLGVDVPVKGPGAQLTSRVNNGDPRVQPEASSAGSSFSGGIPEGLKRWLAIVAAFFALPIAACAGVLEDAGAEPAVAAALKTLFGAAMIAAGAMGAAVSLRRIIAGFRTPPGETVRRLLAEKDDLRTAPPKLPLYGKPVPVSRRNAEILGRISMSDDLKERAEKLTGNDAPRAFVLHYFDNRKKAVIAAGLIEIFKSGGMTVVRLSREPGTEDGRIPEQFIRDEIAKKAEGGEVLFIFGKDAAPGRDEHDRFRRIFAKAPVIFTQHAGSAVTDGMKGRYDALAKASAASIPEAQYILYRPSRLDRKLQDELYFEAMRFSRIFRVGEVYWWIQKFAYSLITGLFVGVIMDYAGAVRVLSTYGFIEYFSQMILPIIIGPLVMRQVLKIVMERRDKRSNEADGSVWQRKVQDEAATARVLRFFRFYAFANIASVTFFFLLIPGSIFAGSPGAALLFEFTPAAYLGALLAWYFAESISDIFVAKYWDEVMTASLLTGEGAVNKGFANRYDAIDNVSNVLTYTIGGSAVALGIGISTLGLTTVMIPALFISSAVSVAAGFIIPVFGREYDYYLEFDTDNFLDTARENELWVSDNIALVVNPKDIRIRNAVPLGSSEARSRLPFLRYLRASLIYKVKPQITAMRGHIVIRGAAGDPDIRLRRSRGIVDQKRDIRIEPVTDASGAVSYKVFLHPEAQPAAGPRSDISAEAPSGQGVQANPSPKATDDRALRRSAQVKADEASAEGVAASAADRKPGGHGTNGAWFNSTRIHGFDQEDYRAGEGISEFDLPAYYRDGRAVHAILGSCIVLAVFDPAGNIVCIKHLQTLDFSPDKLFMRDEDLSPNNRYLIIHGTSGWRAYTDSLISYLKGIVPDPDQVALLRSQYHAYLGDSDGVSVVMEHGKPLAVNYLAVKPGVGTRVIGREEIFINLPGAAAPSKKDEASAEGEIYPRAVPSSGVATVRINGGPAVSALDGRIRKAVEEMAASREEYLFNALLDGTHLVIDISPRYTGTARASHAELSYFSDDIRAVSGIVEALGAGPREIFLYDAVPVKTGDPELARHLVESCIIVARFLIEHGMPEGTPLDEVAADAYSHLKKIATGKSHSPGAILATLGDLARDSADDAGTASKAPDEPGVAAGYEVIFRRDAGVDGNPPERRDAARTAEGVVYSGIRDALKTRGVIFSEAVDAPVYESVANMLMHVGRGEITVVMGRRDDGRRELRMTVSDNGPGIQDIEGALHRSLEAHERVARFVRDGAGFDQLSDGKYGLRNIVYWPDETIIETRARRWRKAGSASLVPFGASYRTEGTTITMSWLEGGKLVIGPPTSKTAFAVPPKADEQSAQSPASSRTMEFAPPSTYDTVFFDIGKVILWMEDRRVANMLAKRSDRTSDEIEPALRSATSPDKKLYEEGKITPEEFFRRLKAKFGLRMEYREFFDAYASDITPIPETVEVIKALKRAGYRLWAISDIGPISRDIVLSRFREIFALLEGVTASCDAGAQKDARLIFDVALRDVGARPDRSVFVDDYPRNLTTAGSVGIRTLKFIRGETDMYKELKTILDGRKADERVDLRKFYAISQYIKNAELSGSSPKTAREELTRGFIIPRLIRSLDGYIDGLRRLDLLAPGKGVYDRFSEAPLGTGDALARVASNYDETVLIGILDDDEANKRGAMRFVGNISRILNKDVRSPDVQPVLQDIYDAYFDYMMLFNAARSMYLAGELPIPEGSGVDLLGLVVGVIEGEEDVLHDRGYQNEFEFIHDDVKPRVIISNTVDNYLVVAVAELVKNAINFSPENAGEVIRGKAHLSVGEDDDFATFSLTVHAPGVGADNLHRLAYVGYTTMPDVTAEPLPGGMGLGLCKVKKIVEFHGGSLRITTPGEDLLKFEVVIPKEFASTGEPLEHAAPEREAVAATEETATAVVPATKTDEQNAESAARGRGFFGLLDRFRRRADRTAGADSGSAREAPPVGRADERPEPFATQGATSAVVNEPVAEAPSAYEPRPIEGLENIKEDFYAYRLADALASLAALKTADAAKDAAISALVKDFPLDVYSNARGWNRSNVNVEEQTALFRGIEHTLSVLTDWPEYKKLAPHAAGELTDNATAYLAGDPHREKKTALFEDGLEKFEAELKDILRGEAPSEAGFRGALERTQEAMLRSNRSDDLSRSPETTGGTVMYLVDDRAKLLNEIESPSNDNICILTDNAGSETFLVLLEAWLLLREGRRVTIYAKQEPTLFGDATIADLDYQSLVFDKLMRERFGSGYSRTLAGHIRSGMLKLDELPLPYLYSGREEDGHKVVTINFGFLDNYDAAIINGELLYGDFVRAALRFKYDTAAMHSLPPAAGLNPLRRATVALMKTNKNRREIVVGATYQGYVPGSPTAGESVVQVLPPAPGGAKSDEQSAESAPAVAGYPSGVTKAFVDGRSATVEEAGMEIAKMAPEGSEWAFNITVEDDTLRIGIKERLSAVSAVHRNIPDPALGVSTVVGSISEYEGSRRIDIRPLFSDDSEDRLPSPGGEKKKVITEAELRQNAVDAVRAARFLIEAGFPAGFRLDDFTVTVMTEMMREYFGIGGWHGDPATLLDLAALPICDAPPAGHLSAERSMKCGMLVHTRPSRTILRVFKKMTERHDIRLFIENAGQPGHEISIIGQVDDIVNMMSLDMHRGDNVKVIVKGRARPEILQGALDIICGMFGGDDIVPDEPGDPELVGDFRQEAVDRFLAAAEALSDQDRHVTAGAVPAGSGGPAEGNMRGAVNAKDFGTAAPLSAETYTAPLGIVNLLERHTKPADGEAWPGLAQDKGWILDEYDDDDFSAALNGLSSRLRNPPIREEGHFIEEAVGLIGAKQAELKKLGRICVAAIDGNSGASKSTNARRIKKKLESSGRKVVLIERDWFIGERTKRYKRQDDEIAEHGVCLIDDEISLRIDKIEREVLDKLKGFNGGTAGSVTLDLRELYNEKGGLLDLEPQTITIDRDTIVIIEGNYLLKKRWREYFDARVLMLISPSIGMDLRRKRDGAAAKGSRDPTPAFWRINTPSFIDYMRREIVTPDLVAVTDTWYPDRADRPREKSDSPDAESAAQPSPADATVTTYEVPPARWAGQAPPRNDGDRVVAASSFTPYAVRSTQNEAGLSASIESTLAVLDTIAAKNLDNDEAYVIRYDKLRLAQAGPDRAASALALLEAYVEALRMRAGAKWRDKVRLVAFTGGARAGGNLISVERYADRTASKLLGSSKIDVPGELNDTAIDIVSILNMAITACQIPEGASVETAKSDYRQALERIGAIYNAISAKPFDMSNPAFRVISLVLPSAARLSTEALREHYRLSIEALRKYA